MLFQKLGSIIIPFEEAICGLNSKTSSHVSFTEKAISYFASSLVTIPSKLVENKNKNVDYTYN